MLLFLLLVLFVFSVAGGSVAYTRFGFAGWSPTAIILTTLAALWFTGNLPGRWPWW